MQKNVFITGATGHIGSHIARAFKTAGYRVTGLTRNTTGAATLARAGIEAVVGRLQAPESWRSASETADVLVHAAVDYAADTFALDRQAVDALLAARAKTGGRFLYTSGVWMVGNTHGSVADERTAPRPIEAVAARAAIEPLVTAAGGIVIRPGVVYGERAGLTAPWFGSEPVVGDGGNHWAMVNVEDLANAYVLAAERAEDGELFHVVDDARFTVGEMVRAAREAAGVRNATQWVPFEEARRSIGAFAEALAIDQRVANDKARSVLGWQPRQPDFVAGVTRYFEEFRGSSGKAA